MIQNQKRDNFLELHPFIYLELFKISISAFQCAAGVKKQKF